jgi:hypothetical protein
VRALFAAFELEALGDGGVDGPGTDTPKVHGVRGAGGSFEPLGAEILGALVLEVHVGCSGVEPMEARCWGPFGVRGAEVPATELSRLARR